MALSRAGFVSYAPLPLGPSVLGDFYNRHGRFPEAEKAYLESIERAERDSTQDFGLVGALGAYENYLEIHRRYVDAQQVQIRIIQLRQNSGAEADPNDYLADHVALARLYIDPRIRGEYHIASSFEMREVFLPGVLTSRPCTSRIERLEDKKEPDHAKEDAHAGADRRQGGRMTNGLGNESLLFVNKSPLRPYVIEMLQSGGQDIMKGIGVAVLLAVSAATLPGSSHMQFQWTEGSRRLEVSARGTVEFADDDRDVKSLSPDGYFRIEENYLLLFSARRYEVTADGTGRLTRTYFDHDRAKALDSQGQAWLMGIMPEVIRKTGLGAAPRLQRILKQGGPSAALSEISRIRDDEPKRIYLQELINHANLNPDQLSSAMLQARKIGSDEEKVGLLEAVAPYFLKDNLREYIFQAAGTIGSDEEHSHVLLELIKRDSSREALRLAAKSAGHIGSDEEKAKALTDIAGRYKGDREVGRSLLSSAGTIGSDEERRHVLSAVLTGAGSDREIPVEALRLSAGIGSDGEKAAVLIQAASRFVDGDMARRAFFDASESIGSDEERRKVLSAVLKRTGLSDATLAAVATCAKTMGSDEEKAGVLAEMAAGSLQGPLASPAFFEAVNSIGSDDDRKRVLLAAAHHAGSSAEIVTQVAKSAKPIGSDEDKAAVLAELAGSSLQDERVRDAFFAAVDGIGSDEERGKVLSAVLTRRGIAKEVVIRAIESAAKVGSDEIKARVLGQAIGASLVDPQVRTAFQKALESIRSDGEYRRLVSAMSKSGAEAH